MGRLKFSLPLFSMIPLTTGIIMLWVFFAILNTLRFVQCSSWILLQAPLTDAVALLGALNHRLYIETENSSIYCLEQNQWEKCSLPPYELQFERAPAWLDGKYEATFQSSGVLQVIRTSSFSDITYYSLLADKQIFACSTNLSTEIESIVQSGLFVWLLIPAVAVVWSIVAFAKIFIQNGQPTLWDFWGKGKEIK